MHVQVQEYFGCFFKESLKTKKSIITIKQNKRTWAEIENLTQLAPFPCGKKMNVYASLQQPRTPAVTSKLSRSSLWNPMFKSDEALQSQKVNVYMYVYIYTSSWILLWFSRINRRFLVLQRQRKGPVTRGPETQWTEEQMYVQHVSLNFIVELC